MFGTLSSFPGSLFESFDRLQRELDPLFEGFAPSSIRAVTRGTFPAVNVGSTPESVEIYVLLPGVEQKDLDLTIQQNVLTLSGSRNGRPEGEEARTYLRERFSGSFQRTIALPSDVDTEQVSAQMKNGILHISVRRRESARQRRITVN